MHSWSPPPSLLTLPVSPSLLPKPSLSYSVQTGPYPVTWEHVVVVKPHCPDDRVSLTVASLRFRVLMKSVDLVGRKEPKGPEQTTPQHTHFLRSTIISKLPVTFKKAFNCVQIGSPSWVGNILLFQWLVKLHLCLTHMTGIYG